MPDAAPDYAARQSVAVLERSVADCQANNLARLTILEDAMVALGKQLTEHCTDEAVRRAKADTMRTIIIAVIAALASFGGALASQLAK